MSLFAMPFVIFYHMYALRANHGNWRYPIVKVYSRFCQSPYGNESDKDWIQSVVYSDSNRLTDVTRLFTSQIHLASTMTMIELMDVLQHDVKGNPKYTRPHSCRAFLNVLGLSALPSYGIAVFDGAFTPPLLECPNIVETLSPSRVVLSLDNNN